MTEPVRWMDSPAEAPHGAAELLRAVEPPPPLDDAARVRVGGAVSRIREDGTVVARVARLPHRGWLAAAAVLLSIGVTAAAVRSCDAPRGMDGSATGPATSMEPVEESAPGPEARVEAPELQEAPAQEPPAAQAPAQEPPAAQAPAQEPPEDDQPARAGGAEPDPEPARVGGAEPDRQPALFGGAEPDPESHRAATRPPPERALGSTDGEGYLSINTHPWSEVFVDGRRVGNTPIVRLRVSAGRHTILLRPRGDADRAVRRTVLVEPGQVHRLVIRH